MGAIAGHPGGLESAARWSLRRLEVSKMRSVNKTVCEAGWAGRWTAVWLDRFGMLGNSDVIGFRLQAKF